MNGKKNALQQMGQIFKDMNKGTTSQMYSTEDWLELVAEEGGAKLQDGAEEKIEIEEDEDEDEDGNERTAD